MSARVPWLACVVLAACTEAHAPPPSIDAGGPAVSTDAAVAQPDAGPAPVPPDPPASSLARPPASGGSMLLLSDGALAAAHPGAESLFIVDLDPPAVRVAIPLDDRVDPGRLAEDAAGHVHLVLRRAGELLTVDPASGAVLARRSVCAAPRGLAYQAEEDRLLVACASGALVAMPAEVGGTASVLAWLPEDLRDVLWHRGRIYVSRFRRAELLELDATGTLLETRRPSHATMDAGRAGRIEREPNTAYRIRPWGDAVLMVHQLSTVSAVDVESLGYGGVPGCFSGVAGVALTRFDPSPSAPVGTGPIAGLALGVDAVPVGDTVWIVSAAGDTTAVMGANAVQRVLPSDFGTPGECPLGDPVYQVGPTLAVEALPSGAVALLRGDVADIRVTNGVTSEDWDVTLPGAVDPSRGHSLFHAMTPSFVACASCHPEGGDDGITWTFLPTAPRRTQSLLGGILGTEPFHRSGDVPSMSAIMQTSFQERMGRAFDLVDVGSIGGWLDAQPAPRGDVPDAAAAARGAALFEGEAGCAGCHAGAQHTDDRNHSIDGEALQTAILLGVSLHGPWLHDGCAQTLEAILDGTCIADPSHTVADPGDRADLLAHLRSL